jgi:hypothetical protein
MKLQKISKDESRDTGMAMVLLFLILFMSTKRNAFLLSAVALHVVNMVVPTAYRFVAVVWLGLSHIVGSIVSRILLSLVFFLVVTPIGLLRRYTSRDALKLREFKKSDESVLLRRNHTFVAADLDRPY